MNVGMKRWGIRLASITALGLVLASSAGNFGLRQAEAASPEQYRCGEANIYERFVAHYPRLGAHGPVLVEEPSGDQVLGRTPGQCGNYTICGELSDLGHQFPLPMAKWNGPDDCGASEAAGLPSF